MLIHHELSLDELAWSVNASDQTKTKAQKDSKNLTKNTAFPILRSCRSTDIKHAYEFNSFMMMKRVI